MSKIILVCDTCFSSNYATNKSSETRIIVKKFCKTCKKHTLHKENK